MRLLPVPGLVVAVLCLAGGNVVADEVIAQTGVPAPAQVPNFSGHWVLQPDPKGGDIAAGGSGVIIERRPANELTLTQDAKTLTVSRSGPNGMMNSVFNLDGSDSKNGNLISNAKWVGSRLVIVNKREIDGTIVTRTTTWWLEAAALKMEWKTAESAGTGGSTTNEMVTVATYKKMSQASGVDHFLTATSEMAFHANSTSL